ncbi:MAG: CoB--CoM heterodisulfide reductase iron-sulfur subunit B family protein [Candidatus Cloacimonadota bacterium]|nr:CoB--CoM heterodisulfide reductase iron-sulfur subunit B family protein [Candidatus Cloacimonadota bacterium]
MKNNNTQLMKIPYFPGCTLKDQAKNFERSALDSAKILGIEFVEIPKWICCGTVESLTSDDDMHHIAPMRNFIRVEEMNSQKIVDNEYRMLTLCSMCFNTLKRSNQFINNNDQETLKKLNDFMYLEEDYQGKVEVIHFFELLREIGFEKVAQKVNVPLKSLKIAPYYGCMLLRPPDIGIDDAENPSIIEEFISSIGADPVDFNSKHRCCGSYHTISKVQIVINSAKKIITDARNHGADAIITSCPLCAFNLDSRQKEIKEQDDSFKQMPIFYFSQLLALAFGLDKDSLGLEDNYINPEPLLKEKGLL